MAQTAGPRVEVKPTPRLHWLSLCRYLVPGGRLFFAVTDDFGNTVRVDQEPLRHFLGAVDQQI